MKSTVTALLLSVLLLSGLFLSCKSVTPPPASPGEPTALKSESPPPGPSPTSVPKPPLVVKPAHAPTIWWGPKPDTTERFMSDMQKYYPDWYRWFTAHPEDIASYFPPGAETGTDCAPKRG
jgi:hypothetical protein